MASWVVYPSQLSQPPDFTDASNTSTRRHHSKSRTGCTVCKNRRIKCDETKPACRQCVDYGRQCSYSITGLQAVAGGPQQRNAHGYDASNDELFEQVWDKLQPLAGLCTLAELSIQKASLRTLLSYFIGWRERMACCTYISINSPAAWCLAWLTVRVSASCYPGSNCLSPALSGPDKSGTQAHIRPSQLTLTTALS